MQGSKMKTCHVIPNMQQDPCKYGTSKKSKKSIKNPFKRNF